MKKRMAMMLFLAAAVCCGADGSNRGGRREFRNMQGGNGQFSRGNMRGGMHVMQNQVFLEAEIAEKFPAEFAEVEALREKYESALAQLAKKAEVTIPESRDNIYRKLRKNHPAEFAEAVKKFKTSPREGMSALMELAKIDGVELFRMPGVQRNSGSRIQPETVKTESRTGSRPDMGALRRKYPEKMQEYENLRRKDPAAARKLLLSIIEADKGGRK